MNGYIFFDKMNVMVSIYLYICMYVCIKEKKHCHLEVLERHPLIDYIYHSSKYPYLCRRTIGYLCFRDVVCTK